MPTYDYECKACGEAFEIFHSMSEPARKKCPKCGKQKLERLIGAGSGFIFKGSGFYITDYRSADYKAQAKADSESASPKPSTASTTSTASAASSPAPPAPGGSSNAPETKKATKT